MPRACFARSLHNGMCCMKLYPFLPAGVKIPGRLRRTRNKTAETIAADV